MLLFKLKGVVSKVIDLRKYPQNLIWVIPAKGQEKSITTEPRLTRGFVFV